MWWLLQAMLVRSWIPGSAHRRFLLRLFGARIGAGTIFKPGLRVKFPWRLVIGDHTWVGEGVWIDNLGMVKIGSHCCISQGVYLCTGNHNWSSPQFDLTVAPIEIHDSAWVCAKAVIAPGVVIGEGAVLSLGSVAIADLDAWGIYWGSPARWMKLRSLEQDRPNVGAMRKEAGHDQVHRESGRDASYWQ